MPNRLHQPHVPLPEIHWSPNEQWVWRKLRRGEEADFNARWYGNSCLLPWADEAWNEEEKARRLIRPEFLNTILLHEPWRSALSNWGFRLGGAYFPASMKMPHAEVTSHFWLSGCRLEGGVGFIGTHFARRLGLEGCFVRELVDFQGAVIEGNFVLDSSRLAEADFNDIQTQGNLFARRATFAGKLSMNRIKVQSGLFMAQGRFEDEVQLLGARIGGQVVFNEAVLAGKLSMDGAEITEVLFMWGVEFINNAPASLIYCKIGGNLQLERAKFFSLDLTGTHAQAVVDKDMEWPDKPKLDHFTYQHLGGLGKGWGQDHMLDRPASWFVGWLAKHKPYSPQPYEQCAKVLCEAGQPGKAKEVLYQGKERERNEPNGDFRRWVWLTASKWLLGHGLTWRFAVAPAAWAVGVLLLSWLIFCLTPCLSKDHSAWWGLGYSLSKLIPLVSFGKDIADLPVASFAARAWFTFQTLFGWFLASLIVAGLAGVGRPGGKS